MTASTPAPAAPVRIALLGCGAMGEEVARRVYAASSGSRYRLVAAVDVDLARAGVVGDLLGVPSVSSLAALPDLEVDALDIRLPHHLHAEAAVAALQAGRHVLVEKPLAADGPGADSIVAAARRSPAVAAVAENYPHLSAVGAARAAIASGRLGELRTVRTTRAYTLGGVWVRDGWRRGAGPSGGILLDQGTHHVSLARQLAGEITAVSAAANRDGETVVLTLYFASGAVGQSLFTWGTPAVPAEAEAVVFGSTGRLDVRVAYDDVLGRAEFHGDGDTAAVALSPLENYYDSHRTMVENWVDAIVSGGSPRVTVEDAAVDLAVVLAATDSLENGGRVVPVDTRARLDGAAVGA